MVDVAGLADHLVRAQLDRVTCQLPSEMTSDLSLEDAYEIQFATIERRLAVGERIVGAKLGFTSRAKQERMGVDVPIYAWLTDAMILPTGSPLRLPSLIHPRAEPEIVFVMGEDLEGPGAHAGDVLDATKVICCGLEIIDSRYEGFRFTLPDVVADNASAARILLGHNAIGPYDTDLALLGVVLSQGGHVEATAAGAAVLGHPAEAVALLANHLHAIGRKLEKGWIIYSGGLTDALPLTAGTPVTADFAHLGSVTLVAEE